MQNWFLCYDAEGPPRDGYGRVFVGQQTSAQRQVHPT
jgi:hypothetical protein